VIAVEHKCRLLSAPKPEGEHEMFGFLRALFRVAEPQKKSITSEPLTAALLGPNASTSSPSASQVASEELARYRTIVERGEQLPVFAFSGVDLYRRHE